MLACQFKQGFFTLRTCERPATKQCESCGRGACPFHLSASSGWQFCVECAGQQQQAQQTDADAEYYEDDWVYSYRDSYYRGGYSPFLYSQRDYDSFERHDDGADDFDDESAGGDFSDS